MKDLTCIVVGGGFAGIHALKAIHKACHKGIGGRKLRLILIDMGSAHVRKVLLFRPAVSEEGLPFLGNRSCRKVPVSYRAG